MKIVIPGGTGQVGTLLARHFQRAGHEVVALGRHVAVSEKNEKSETKIAWRLAKWDAETIGDWAGELDGADVVINLAGRSVNCRYTQKNRRLIKNSRVNSVRVVGEAIAKAKRPPRIWLQASTATIYAHRFDTANDEAHGIIGGDEPNAPDTWRFSIDVAKSWERTLDEAETPQTRKVKLRSAIIMSPDRGGIFDTLLGLVRLGLGGKAGDGRQYVSWIHENDFTRAIDWLIAHDSLDDAVNLASPNPLPYAEFMRALRKAAGVPIGLPATKWMLEIGTFLMRTETELVLKSRRVIPARLEQSGFTFQFPNWPTAANELYERWE